MTAGKGIVHAEMPGSFEQDSYGFQLWINLEAKNKFVEPRYQEFNSNTIPFYEDANMKAKVVSGKVFDVTGPIVACTPAWFIDFNFTEVDKVYRHTIPAGWVSIIVVYEGALEVQGSIVKSAVQVIQFLPNES